MDLLGALADPVRREILERLRCGPLTAGEIATAFPISRPAVSRHVQGAPVLGPEVRVQWLGVQLQPARLALRLRS